MKHFKSLASSHLTTLPPTTPPPCHPWACHHATSEPTMPPSPHHATPHPTMPPSPHHTPPCHPWAPGGLHFTDGADLGGGGHLPHHGQDQERVLQELQCQGGGQEALADWGRAWSTILVLRWASQYLKMDEIWGIRGFLGSINTSLQCFTWKLASSWASSNHSCELLPVTVSGRLKAHPGCWTDVCFDCKNCLASKPVKWRS